LFVHLFPQVLQLLTSLLVLTHEFVLGHTVAPDVEQVPVVHDWQPPLALQALLQQRLSPEQKPVLHSAAVLQVAPPLFFGKQAPFKQ
jgi:hypothetical protein